MVSTRVVRLLAAAVGRGSWCPATSPPAGATTLTRESTTSGCTQTSTSGPSSPRLVEHRRSETHTQNSTFLPTGKHHSHSVTHILFNPSCPSLLSVLSSNPGRQAGAAAQRLRRRLFRQTQRVHFPQQGGRATGLRHRVLHREGKIAN